MSDEYARPVVWLGDSLKQVRGFPAEVRRDIGAALYDAQKGGKPPDAKPFKGVGSGVFEIVTRFDTDTYRTVYTVKIGERVYVLHAFQKKAKKGINTPQFEVDLIKRRYKQAVRMEKGGNTMSKGDFVVSSGNVFADMGLEDAEELMLRTQLGHAVRKILEEKKRKQREISALLEIDQAEVSKLMNGKYHLFSESRLLGFLSRLDRKVIMQIKPRQKGERTLELI